jgi:hypothetical protein
MKKSEDFYKIDIVSDIHKRSSRRFKNFISGGPLNEANMLKKKYTDQELKAINRIIALFLGKKARNEVKKIKAKIQFQK